MLTLVLNMGLKSIRSIIFDESGKKLASSSRTLTSVINDVRVEQDPEEWTDKAVEVMADSVAAAGVRQVDFITVTTSASCLVCMDAAGKSLRNAIMVSDKRAAAEAEEIQKNPAFAAVLSDTGLQVSASLLLPKILWVKKHEPEIFEKTAYFLTPNDFLIYFLSGTVSTDYLNAIKYHYSLSKNQYPLELLRSIGIPTEKLPRVENTGVEAGRLTANLTERLGLKSSPRIILSSYDAICSFVGSGVSQEGQASDVSGTVTVFRMLSRKKDIRRSEKIYTVPFRQDPYWIVGGSNNMGGGLIEWVKQCYYTKEEYPYEIMEKEAGESEVGARGIIFLPYLLGERAPIWNDRARGVFFGLERMHTRKDMTRAVFEAAAFISVRVNTPRLAA